MAMALRSTDEETAALRAVIEYVERHAHRARSARDSDRSILASATAWTWTR